MKKILPLTVILLLLLIPNISYSERMNCRDFITKCINIGLITNIERDESVVILTVNRYFWMNEISPKDKDLIIRCSKDFFLRSIVWIIGEDHRLILVHPKL